MNSAVQYLGSKVGRSSRRLGNSRIDFSKLEVGMLWPVACSHFDCSASCNVLLACAQLVSLQRYRKAYKLPDYPTASRDDLLQAIMRHFANVVSL